MTRTRRCCAGRGRGHDFELVPRGCEPVLKARRAGAVLHPFEESPDHHRLVAERLRRHPEVQQCYVLSGRWDYAVLLSTASVRDLRDLGNQLFKSDDNIRRYDTMFILDIVKSGSSLPADSIV
jgi:Lrp/AsnC family transcriptional regulator, leucine-responsive regulatory protein